MPGRDRAGSDGIRSREGEALQSLPKLSVRLHGGMTPQQCVAQAQAAEAAGLDGIAFAENPFTRGILPVAAATAPTASPVAR
jgi:alkanesulfonate monooxygenase SsuD/methylene tetrahydromethanopterin reductase-like flavin-dependent oxidoreductase (luciferase family)